MRLLIAFLSCLLVNITAQAEGINDNIISKVDLVANSFASGELEQCLVREILKQVPQISGSNIRIHADAASELLNFGGYHPTEITFEFDSMASGNVGAEWQSRFFGLVLHGKIDRRLGESVRAEKISSIGQFGRPLLTPWGEVVTQLALVNVKPCESYFSN